MKGSWGDGREDEEGQGTGSCEPPQQRLGEKLSSCFFFGGGVDNTLGRAVLRSEREGQTAPPSKRECSGLILLEGEEGRAEDKPNIVDTLQWER